MNDDIFNAILARLDYLEQLIKNVEIQPRSEYTGGFARLTVADLPLAGQAGQCYWVTDGRKSGEGAGAGTGVIGFWNVATNEWLRVEDNAVVQA